MMGFGLGQHNAGGTLLYTATFDPDGGESGWVYASDGRHCSLLDVEREFDCVMTQELRQVLVKHPISEVLGASRWSMESVMALLAGERVDPVDLWCRLVEYFTDHFKGGDYSFYVVVTLYVFITYLFVLAAAVPYLFIVGPPGTGKTFLAELLERVSFNPLLVTSVTPAALARSLHYRRRVLLIDEHYDQEPLLMKSLLAGYRFSGAVTKCAPGPLLTMDLACFGPKVMLSTEELANPALESRVIRLETKPTPQTTRRPLQRELDTKAALLRDDLYRFGLQFGGEVLAAYERPRLLPGVENRDDDLMALPMAVATVLDRASGGTIRVAEVLATFIRDHVRQRKKSDHLEGERATWARLVCEFVQGTKPTKCAHKGFWFLAEDFKDFVNRRKSFGRTFRRTKEVGERLNLFDLVYGREVIDPVAGATGTRDVTKPARKQRVAYLFNLREVKKAAGLKIVKVGVYAK